MLSKSTLLKTAVLAALIGFTAATPAAARDFGDRHGGYHRDRDSGWGRDRDGHGDRDRGWRGHDRHRHERDGDWRYHRHHGYHGRY